MSAELDKMRRDGFGWRCESFGEIGGERYTASASIAHEVLELGNYDELDDAIDALSVGHPQVATRLAPHRIGGTFENLSALSPSDERRLNLAVEAVVGEIHRRFGPSPYGRWLTTKRGAKGEYCQPGEDPESFWIPKDSLALTDGGFIGVFFVSKSPFEHRGSPDNPEFPFERVPLPPPPSTLGGYADIIRVDPGAELQVDDILVQRQGSEDTVGTVLELVREPRRLEHGSPFVVRLRPLAKRQLLPSYLYYALQHVHQQGYYRQWARGSISLQGIPKAALVQVPLKPR